MSAKKGYLNLTPRDHKRARPNSASDCLLAVAANRQYGGKWTATPGGLVQEGTGRRLGLGWDGKRKMIRYDITRTSAARRSPVRVAVYERGKPSRKAQAAKGGAGAGAVMMAASGSLWWITALVMAVIAIPVFAVLVMNKVSVPSVTRSAAPKPASPARWPHISGGDPFARTRGTGD